jgi:transposase
MRLHKSKFFLQDRTPCHKSKKVMDHLKESKKKFGILDCPSNSVDLNLIENCWSHMKRKLKDDGNITSLPKLTKRSSSYVSPTCPSTTSRSCPV